MVGDLHGVYTQLKIAMHRLRFDPSKDRLFCVGDLIDRGPNSLEVVRLLDMPYIYSVLGNHEDTLLQLNSWKIVDKFDLEKHRFVERGGLQWWNHTPRQDKVEILNRIARLPLVIEVETIRSNIGLLHAEVPIGMSWGEFTKRIQAGDADVVQSALWGRERAGKGICHVIPGIYRVFAGHTTQSGGVSRYGNFYIVDTGAVYSVTTKEKGTCLSVMNLLHRSDVLLSPDAKNGYNLLDDPVRRKDVK